MTKQERLYNLQSQPMPIYSKGEEVFNLASHASGGGLAIVILVSLVVLGLERHLELYKMIALIIYGLSAVTLYTMSSVYHGLKSDLLAKKVFRIIDHCTIYFLIAGTYTPICVLKMANTFEGNFILIMEWTLVIIGIILNALWLNKKPVKIISMIIYLFTGWAIVFVPGAIKYLTSYEFYFILAGGIMYSIGVIFYGLGKNKKWSHSIFHIFVVLGTLLQFIGILAML